MVFMPASVKKGDIFAGSSRAEVPVDAPARADTAEIESDKDFHSKVLLELVVFKLRPIQERSHKCWVSGGKRFT
jgi:hypothetical protein